MPDTDKVTLIRLGFVRSFVRSFVDHSVLRTSNSNHE